MPRQSAFSAIQWRKPAAAVELPLEELHPIARAIREFGLPVVPNVSPKEELETLLRAAAEVEHQLLVEYLYAVYSLTDSADPLWRSALVNTAKEEMGHLLTVQNLLLALGGPPHLQRLTPENTAQQPFPFTLRAASTLTLAKFTCVESPLLQQLSPKIRQRAQAAFDYAKSHGSEFFTPDGIHQVGLLYARIYSLLKSTDAPEGPWTDLPADKLLHVHVDDDAFDPTSLDFQGTVDIWNLSFSRLPNSGDGIFVSSIANRSDALRAVHDIAMQGEGIPGGTSHSHFLRFLPVFEAIKAAEEAGETENFLPLPTDPVFGARANAAPPERRITAETAVSWCELFDLQYALLLSEIALSLRLKATDFQRDKRPDLAGFALNDQMQGAIRNIARKKLILLPREADRDAATAPAAPPFSDPSFPDGASRRGIAQRCLELVTKSLKQIAQMKNDGIPDNDGTLQNIENRVTALRDEVLIPVINLDPGVNLLP